MSNIEQISRLTVLLSSKNSFNLQLREVSGNHTLSIVEPVNFGHDTPPPAQDLLRTVMLAHLIAPHFPRTIETNFPVESSQFLTELYAYYGYQSPRIIRAFDVIRPHYQPATSTEFPVISRATAHSGGLDSVYRIVKSIAADDGILAVHVRNLNPKAAYAEAKKSREQCQQWSVPYQQVRLVNSSGNTDFDCMRTRDMLLSLMVAITARPHRSQQVLIEGDMSSDPATSHFSENTLAWEMFNRLLGQVGLNMTVNGQDPGDIETVGEIIKLEKELGFDILPLVQNCFSAPFQRPSTRKKWERETPYLAEHSPPQWCGSCLKCRRLTLGRIFYHDPKLAGLSSTEIAYFVKDTEKWIKKYPHNRDLLSVGFRQHLNSL